jgi:rubrerythrin
MNTSRQPVRLMQPQSKTYRKIRTREQLQEHLQWALTVELSTIPPYLCAAYSIQDASSQAARVLRSVMVEEMLHVMQVANLLNAIGGQPHVTGEYSAAYPTFMPHHAAGGPFIQLQRASRDVVANVFMQIEQPYVGRKLDELPEGDDYETLAQFYEAVEQGFITCAREGNLFNGDRARQQTASYFGGGGGRLIEVVDLRSALLAIQEIVQQGEGTRGAYERWGADSPPEGPPTVGTFGVNSRGAELSHYFRFEALATGVVPIPETWPMETNFRTAHLRAAWARALSDLFNACYVDMLRSLEASMQRPAADGGFFRACFPLMHSVLPPLATLLMQTPLRGNNVVDSPAVDGGNASKDLAPLLATAGPSFEYVQWPRERILETCRGLLHASEGPEDATTAPGYRQLFTQTLAKVLAELERLPPHEPALPSHER